MALTVTINSASLISAVQKNIPISQVISTIPLTFSADQVTNLYNSTVNRYSAISSLYTGTTITSKVQSLIQREVHNQIQTSLMNQLRGLLPIATIQSIINGYKSLSNTLSFTAPSSSTISALTSTIKSFI